MKKILAATMMAGAMAATAANANANRHHLRPSHAFMPSQDIQLSFGYSSASVQSAKAVGDVEERPAANTVAAMTVALDYHYYA